MQDGEQLPVVRRRFGSQIIAATSAKKTSFFRSRLLVNTDLGWTKL